MGSGYGWLKVAHIVAVVLWLGGSCAMAVLTWLIAKKADRAVLRAFLHEAAFYGPVVVGPASLLTLITGLVMTGMTGAFKAMWVSIGFAGIIIHFVFGPVLLRKASIRVTELLSAPSPDEGAFRAAVNRMVTLSLIYLVLMFAVAAVMVLKPV